MNGNEMSNCELQPNQSQWEEGLDLAATGISLDEDISFHSFILYSFDRPSFVAVFAARCEYLCVTLSYQLLSEDVVNAHLRTAFTERCV
jgi:hypothetical protein